MVAGDRKNRGFNWRFNRIFSSMEKAAAAAAAHN